MKKRRLSEIDLARFAALPAGPMLEHALRGYEAGGGSWSYEPVRASTPDLVGATTPLLGKVAMPTWKQVKQQIEAACTHGAPQREANVAVGHVLFDTARRYKWDASTFPMGRLPIGISETVSYWSDVVLADRDGLFVPFFDHRRGCGLSNGLARQFVFSMQNIWIRERNPDLANARLAIVRFPSEGSERCLSLEFHSDSDLLSYEEVDGRVRVVYETWARILEERARGAKGTGTHGRSNPFGF